MILTLSTDSRTALADPDTVKVLAGIDANGFPHVAFKDSLRIRPDGYLEYDEIIESSDMNKVFVNAVWFGRTVSVLLLTGARRSFLIKGSVYRAIIAGWEFKERYLTARKRLGDVDLSTSWVIEPTFEREDTLEKRRIEEEERHPLLRHVDRLLHTRNTENHAE
ncbi:MAG: hypothetical protein LBU13_11770 [Synergistaceae bacterium]|nr:hypothetical protein [Synergistaceae bacterium]